MPRIKDVEPVLNQLGSEIKNATKAKSVYVFGSYIENQNDPNHRINDIDIIAKVPFHSEDLISIDRGTLSMKLESLEEEGYDSDAVSFSKSFVKMTQQNIDHWVISSDKKLLHWGPIATDQTESAELNKEAEDYASAQSGTPRRKLTKASENIRHNWYNSYLGYLDLHFSDMPSGWYASKNADIKEILSNAIKLA